jgi:hypothetical protein
MWIACISREKCSFFKNSATSKRAHYPLATYTFTPHALRYAKPSRRG